MASLGIFVNMSERHEKRLLQLHARLEALGAEGHERERMTVLASIARIYEEIEDHAEAIDRYLQIVAIAETLGDTGMEYRTHLRLGKLHLLHRLNDGASRHYLRAAELAPERTQGLEARLHHANVLLFGGRFDEAESIITDAMGQPRIGRAVRFRATQLRAILCNNRKRYDESLELLEACLQLVRPDDVERIMDIRKSMALSLYYTGRQREAIEVLDAIGPEAIILASKRLKKLIYEVYTACYSELRDFEKAFHYQGLFKDEDHAITKEQVANRITAIEVNNRLIRIQHERATFQKRSEELAEKNRQIEEARRKSDELLKNILPAEVAEELKEHGRVQARHFASVTVLFTDFSGFTAISERLSPAELVHEIDVCFRGFDEIIGRHGIEKIKTIGDAYMAVSGLPAVRSDHAVAALRAALEMRDFMDARPPIVPASAHSSELRFKVRIGLHSGPVVAGVVGSRKFAYDVWGDTVNTASRMESSGQVGKVNISDVTRTLADGLFHFEPRGHVAAKGKGDMEMFFAECL